MEPEIKTVRLKMVMHYFCFVCGKAKAGLEEQCSECNSSATRIELKEIAYVDKKKDPRQHGPI